LRDDLLRRDFTVNTLALDLGQASYGRLTDLCDGVADLRCGLLRVLHDRSFLDDPTRILRGARLAARLGLTLEPHTAALLAAALAQNAFATVTPQRLLGEICLALHEPAPEHILAALAAWGALAALHPALHHTPQLERQLARARNAAFPAVDPADVALALITYDLSPAAREDLIARYQPQGSHMRLLRDITKAHEQVELLRAGAVANSVVDRVLRGIGEVALRAAQIVEPEPAAELIARYLDELRGVQIAVDGVFLKQMGLAPGPCYRELLEGLRAAVLDGIVTTKEEQEGWLRMRLSVER
jgi:tRNA nucleotidyltransferase (CCA-adding enzyme)